MAQSVKRISDDEFVLEISDKDLAIFFRAFAQEPKEAMRIAKLFGEEELSFVAMCSDNRKQILEQVDEKELMKLVAQAEQEAREA